ncbi:MAG: PGF-pre-PGF domain-containing protein [Candidatus Aenigmarchaeota archaeon]|nr:PGF-pre-PGF domain-containing protein [Candidatus Aenigmarchaeota archaeon]
MVVYKKANKKGNIFLLVFTVTILLSFQAVFAQPDLWVYITIEENPVNASINIPIYIANMGNETAESVTLRIEDFSIISEETLITVQDIVPIEPGVVELLNYEVNESGKHMISIIADTTDEKSAIDNWLLLFPTKIIEGKDLRVELSDLDEEYVEDSIAGVRVWLVNIGNQDLSNVVADLSITNNDTTESIWNATVDIIQSGSYDELVRWIPSGGESTITLTATVDGDVNLTNNVDVIGASTTALMGVNFTLTDNEGNGINQTVEFEDHYRINNEENVLILVPNKTQKIISETKVGSEINEIKFLGSNPSEMMELVFEKNNGKSFAGKYFYQIYSFRPSWDYLGMEIVFNSYQRAKKDEFSIYACSEWDWAGKDCNSQWEELETLQGSIKGVVDDAEAVALLGPNCGNGICDSGESSANCREDCPPAITGGPGSSPGTSPGTGPGLPSQQQKSKSVTISGIGEVSLNITARTVGEVTIEQREAPAVQPSGVVYTYLNIDPNAVNVVSAEIRFQVSKEWISDNEINSNMINLLEFKDNKWIALDTTQTGQTDSYLEYKATVEGFSIFAISGEKIANVCEEGKLCTEFKLMKCENNEWEIEKACIYGCNNETLDCNPLPKEKLTQKLPKIIEDYSLYIIIIIIIAAALGIAVLKFGFFGKKRR